MELKVWGGVRPSSFGATFLPYLSKADRDIRDLEK
jgi:hypothetical protein